MKTRNLFAIAAITTGGLFQAKVTHAQQELIQLLNNAHFPSARFEQAIFPFNTGNNGNKPTGIRQRLMAMYYMTVQGTEFVRVSDSIRYFRPANTGNLYDLANATMGSFLYVQPSEPYNPTLAGLDPTDSIITYGIDGNAFGANTTKQISTLNSAGQTIEQVLSLYDNGSMSWTNASRISYTYNTSDQVVLMVKEDWVSNAWQPNNKTECVYNAGQKLTGVTYSTWDDGANAWKFSDRNTYIYDANNNWTSDFKEMWNGTWINTSLFTYTYNASNKRIESVSQAWNGTAWFNYAQTLTQYNGSGFRFTDTQKEWDSNSSGWLNASKRTYSYDSNNKQTNTKREVWDGTSSAWITDAQYDFTYEGDKISTMVNKSWLNNTWDTGGRFRVDFDANLNGIMLTDETWNSIGGYFESLPGDSRYMFFYEDYDDGLSIKEDVASLNITVFPNPAKDQLDIQVPGQNIRQITVWDVQGKQIYQSKSLLNSSRITIPVMQFPDGIYVLRLQSGKGAGTKTFVVKH